MNSLESWYSGYRLPKLFSEQDRIKKFVADCLGIFSSLVNSKTGSNLRIAFVKSIDIQIAATDIENEIIYFSEHLFSTSKSERFNPDASIHETLAMVMGVQIHESGHHQYTDMPYEDGFKLCGYTFNTVKHQIMNLVDDIYIDYQNFKNNKNFRWCMAAANDYVFSKKERNKVFTEAANIKIIEDINQATNIFNALIFFKTSIYYDIIGLYSSFKSQEIHDCIKLLKKAGNMNNFTSRIELSEKIYDILFKKFEDYNESIGDYQLELDEESTEKIGELMPDSNDLSDETIESLLDLSAILEADEDYNYSMNKIDVLDIDIRRSDAVGKDFNHIELEPTIENLKSFLGDRFNSYGDHIHGDLDTGIEIDSKYSKFSKLMRAFSDTKRYSGPQLNRGNNISKIYRIATDQKIYNKPYVIRGLSQQEIIILVDMSGSMGGINITEALSAAKGAILGLEAGGHKVAVYGHSADFVSASKHYFNLVIFNLKSFSDNSSAALKKIDDIASVMYPSALLRQNNDDLAIDYMRKKFTKQNNQKTLIVISDGEPMSSRGSGKELVEKAQQNVKRLKREIGCSVLSISIDKCCISANNTIYGEDNNVYNKDPSVVTDILSKIAKANHNL